MGKITELLGDPSAGHDGLSAKALERCLGVSRSTLRRLLKILEQHDE